MPIGLRPKLKMQLILLGESSLYVKVEEVDARFVNNGDNEKTFLSSSGFLIRSCSYVTFDRSSLELLGSFRGEEHTEHAVSFAYHSEREAFIERMEAAIKEWSENWEGFKTCSHSCTNHCPPPQPARVEKRLEETLCGVVDVQVYTITVY